MGNFAPTFLAFLLNCADIFIFRTPNCTCFPYLSYLIFIAAVFCLLWDVPLNPLQEYPRKLFPMADFILEFLVAKLILETAVTDFWVPLQTYAVALVPKFSELFMNAMKKLFLDCQGVCEIGKVMKWQGTLLFIHYAISTFFLLCLAHTTRVVDFRLLRCGGDVFINDVKRRSRRFFLKRLCNNAGICLRPTSSKHSGCRKRSSCVTDRNAFINTEKPYDPYESEGSAEDFSDINNYSNYCAANPYESQQRDDSSNQYDEPYLSYLPTDEPYSCTPYDSSINHPNNKVVRFNLDEEREPVDWIDSSSSRELNDLNNRACCHHNY